LKGEGSGVPSTLPMLRGKKRRKDKASVNKRSMENNFFMYEEGGADMSLGQG